MRTLSALGMLNSAAHASTISRTAYEGGTGQPSFAVMFDTESVPQAEHSGYPVSTGGLLTVSFKSVGASGTYATKCHVYCQFDAILELGSDTASVLQ